MATRLWKLANSGVGWSLMYTAARLLSGLITLPLAAAALPSEELGLYYMLTGIGSMAVILDFGLSSTVSRNAAFAIAGARSLRAVGVPEHRQDEPNLPLLADLVGCTKGYYLMVGSGLLLLLATLGSLVVFRSSGTALSPQLWGVFALSTCYNLATLHWPYLLMGIGRILEGSRFGVLLQGIQGVLLVGGLLSGFGLWALAVAPFIGSLIVRPLTKAKFLQTSGLQSDPPISKASMVLLKTMWPMAWRQGVSGVGTFLLQRSSILIAGSALGLVTTAQYGLTTNTLAVLFQVGTITLFVAIPRLSQLRVQGNYPEIRTQFLIRCYAGLLAGTLAGLALLLVGNTLLSGIGSGTMLLPASYFLPLILIALMDAHTNCYMQLCYTANHNPFVLPLLITGVLQIALAMVLVEKLGIWAFVAAKTITEAPFLWWWTVVEGWKTVAAGTPEKTS